MSSTEVLEANVAAIRVDLNELKADFRAAVARIERQRFADRVEAQFAELRADNRSISEMLDRNFERLSTKFDADLKETNEALSELTKTVLKIDCRLAAISWVGGGLVALITLAITVGKALE